MCGRGDGRGGPSVPQYSFGSAARRCVCAPRRARRAAGRFRVPYLLRGLLSWWVVGCPGPVLRLPSVACVPAWASCVPLRSAVLCGALRGFGCSAVLCGALRCFAVLCGASGALRCSAMLAVRRSAHNYGKRVVWVPPVGACVWSMLIVMFAVPPLGTGTIYV